MVNDMTQSPEAELDREIDDLVGKLVRGTMTEKDEVRLGELQSLRAKMMRPPPPSPPRRPNYYHRRYG